jgi:cell division protein FtsW
MIRSSRPPVDRIFLTLILVELVFGFIMLASASGPLSFQRFHTGWHYAWHQLLVIAIGLVGCWFFARIDYRKFERMAPALLVGSAILLILVFIPGLRAGFGTAKSWIVLGGQISLQPIELVKLAFVIYLAALFSGRGSRTMKETLVPAGVSYVVLAILVMLQPDLGGMVLLAGLLMLMGFAAGVPLRYFLTAAAAGAIGIFALIKAAPYRAARLTVFLHPELDPQGIGYQINQALLAIGSGGFFGLGLGHSRQKFSYLPEILNDSIFPIIAEELGFLFSIAVVVLVTAILLRGMKIARGARDPFGRLLVIGIVGWFTIQAFLNIGAMLSLLPLTGLPLPFVSYGGTAMIVNLCAVGVVLSVSRGTGRT